MQTQGLDLLKICVYRTIKAKEGPLDCRPFTPSKLIANSDAARPLWGQQSPLPLTLSVSRSEVEGTASEQRQDEQPHRVQRAEVLGI